MLLKRIDEKIVSIFLMIMCVVIFFATVGRFSELYSMPWAEEVARYCMIWMMFIGIGIAARKDAHFKVSVITNLLPKIMQKGLVIVRAVLVIGVSLFIAKYSITIIKSQILMGQVSPSLKIPMWILYTSIPIGCVLMSIFYMVSCYKKFKALSE
ncbi:MAG: TRAP transporter small permease [Clostridia bacterium]|nr:TRAP transporter small permease [Clostridia bacterium]